jgi:hypothetical protein
MLLGKSSYPEPTAAHSRCLEITSKEQPQRGWVETMTAATRGKGHWFHGEFLQLLRPHLEWRKNIRIS